MKRKSRILPTRLSLLAVLLLWTSHFPSVASSKLPTVVSSWKVDLAEGNRFLESKQLEKAEACFQDALKEVKRSPGRSTDDVVLCMQSLAKVLYMRDFIEEPLHIYKKSLKKLERAHGEKSIRIVPTLIIVGGIYEDEGDYRKATKYYARALAITDREKGPDSLDSATCQHLLGRAYLELAIPAKCEACYSIALTNLMNQKTLPSSDFLEEVLSDYIDLMRKTENGGKVLTSRFQKELWKDEIGTLKQRRGILSSAFSKQVSVSLAGKDTSQSDITNIKLRGLSAREPIKSKRADTASEITPSRPPADEAALQEIKKQRVLFYERMIELDIKSLGPNHPSVARDLSGLATIYLTQKKYDRAKPLLMRALKIYENAYVDESHLIKQTKTLLALISAEQNPSPDSSYVPYLADLPPVPLAAQKLEVSFRLNYLAFMYLCQGKVLDARKIGYWALACTARASGEQSLLSAASMVDLGRALRMTGQASRAARLEGNARAIWRHALAEKRARLLP